MQGTLHTCTLPRPALDHSGNIHSKRPQGRDLHPPQTHRSKPRQSVAAVRLRTASMHLPLAYKLFEAVAPLHSGRLALPS